MKSNLKEVWATVVAVFVSHVVLDLAKFDYNVFMDPFDWWKAVVKFGTPMLAILIAFGILHLAKIPSS